jgi:hypothetical protein
VGHAQKDEFQCQHRRIATNDQPNTQQSPGFMTCFPAKHAPQSSQRQRTQRDELL